MKFAQAQWLWSLLILPLLYFALIWDNRRRQKKFLLFADRKVWAQIVPELDISARVKKGSLIILVIFFSILSLARPQWGTHEETLHVTGLDVMIALDVSNSMEVEDVFPNRLKKAKHLIRSLLDRLNGDRVGVIAFAASSYVACPLTTDLEYVYDAVEALHTRSVSNQGTDLGIALETAARALDRGAEEVTDKNEAAQSEKSASKVVLLISDGEDHEQQAVEGAKKLTVNGAKLYVFGIGTQKGGPVPLRDENGQLRSYKKDRNGAGIVSVFRPDALTDLASQGGGKYWNVTNNETELDELLQDMGALDRSDFAEKRYVVFEDRFQYPLAIAVILLIIELAIPAHRLIRMALFIFFPTLLLLSFSTSAQAVPLNAYLENKKGLEAFEDGKLDEAKNHFGTAQALDPFLAELQYNQSTVQAQTGELEGAIQGFAGAAKTSLEKGNINLLGKSYFNLGSALGSKSEFNGAIQAYLNTIDAAIAGKDKQLEADARKNLELLIQQQQEQQKQKQQQQQKEQNEKSKDDKDKQENKDNQDDKEKNKADNKQQQDQQYQDNSKNRKKEFKSLKLSKEDAERVMAELSNRERELQAKLKKQRGNPQKAQKDW